jgi:hypothetical protein
MSSGTISGLVIVAVFAIYFVLAWRRADFSLGDGSGEVRYSSARLGKREI